MFDVIAFDADDTLWHNETLFAMTHEKFTRLLAPYCDSATVQRRLDQTERGNLRYFGYGIKGFALSMIETAIELTQGQISGKDIQQILSFAKEMLTSPVEPLEHVNETLAALAASYPLMLITKGDLFDQESKLARSGLAPYFSAVEILSDKTCETYHAVLTRHHIPPHRFVMVGNSLRSDIFPVLSLGGQAIYIPYPIAWVHECVVPERDDQSKEYLECDHIEQLPSLLGQLKRSVSSCSNV